MATNTYDEEPGDTSMLDRILSTDPLRQVSGNLSDKEIPLYGGNRNAWDQAIAGPEGEPPKQRLLDLPAAQSRMQMIEDNRNRIAAQHAQNIEDIKKELSRAKSEQQRKILQDELARESALASDIEGQRERATEQTNYDVAFAGTTQPISPTDTSELVNLPTTPTTKRNAIAAGLESPFSDELKRRMGNIVPNAEAEKLEIQKNANVMQALYGDAIVAQQRQGQLASEAVILKQQTAAQRQSEAAGIIARGGVDIGDINSRVNQAAIAMPDLFLQLQEQQQLIADKRNSNFLENPVGWIFDQITVKQDIKRHNDIARQYNLNEEFVKSAPAAIKSAIDSNAPKYLAMSNAEAQNLAEQQRTIADEKIIKLREDAVKSGVASNKEARAVDRQATQDLGIAEQREYNLEQVALNRKNAAEQTALTNLRIENELAEKSRMRELTADDKKEKARIAAAKEDDRIALDKHISDSLGPIFGVRNLKEYDRSTPAMKKLMDPVLKSYIEEGGVKLGLTPVDVLQVANISGVRAASNEGEAMLLGQMKKWGNDFDTSLERQQMVMRNAKKEEIENAKNVFIKSSMEKWKNNPTTQGIPLPDGTTWRGWNIHPIEQIATQPSLANNKFAIETNKINSTLPQGISITPQMVIDSLAKQVNDLTAAGKTAEAKELFNQAGKDGAAFIQYGMKDVNKVLNPEKFGLTESNTFPIPIQSSSFGGVIKPDIASVKGFYEAILKSQARLRTAELGFGGVPMFRGSISGGTPPRKELDLEVKGVK